MCSIIFDLTSRLMQAAVCSQSLFPSNKKGPKMRHSLILRIIAISFSALGANSVTAASKTQFVSHRAVYDLELDRAKQSNIEIARGRIVYELIGSDCEGFAQNFRQIIELRGAELGSRVIDTRSTTFEEGDGSGLTFSNRTETSFSPSEQTDGRAQKLEQKVAIKTTSPTQAVIEYSEVVLFPIEHYAKLIETAVFGGKTLNAKVFDGSQDGTTLSDTFAVIGPPIKNAAFEHNILNASFDQLSRWPITISYFDYADTKSEQPEYTMFFELFENGVARNLRLDFGDFSIIGNLKALELIKTPKCDAKR